MVLWRISRHRDLRGIGGLKAAGRWHYAGDPIVYLAETPAAAGCWSGTVTSAWKPNARPWNPSQEALEWGVMTQTMTQTIGDLPFDLSKPLINMVGTTGFEPATSSVSTDSGDRNSLKTKRTDGSQIA
jgi:hypothetical protein